MEAVNTNVIDTKNVLTAVIEEGVRRCMGHCLRMKNVSRQLIWEIYCKVGLYSGKNGRSINEKFEEIKEKAKENMYFGLQKFGGVVIFRVQLLQLCEEGF